MAYQGLRWLKCDLHMHNPLDNNWISPCNGLSKVQLAEQFAAACHTANIDAIGLTSHSYSGLQFYQYLDTELKKIEQDTGHKIYFFPGFEITTTIGLGVHIICLFNPGTNNLDHIISSIGGDPTLIGTNQSVKIQKHLKDLLHDIQEIHHGIVILPHVFSNHGLLDRNSYPDNFAPGDFTLADLYAVEVNKPVYKMNINFQKLFRAGSDCIAEWRRNFPIATLMSSDCKQLIAHNTNGIPLENSIGYRYTWIKMSCPSIESLKQAFLDHTSRICLSEKSPEENNHHPHIVSICVKNSKFLEDQEVCFSPNLNCVIGGRGSGKSSLLEYLRLALRKDNGIELNNDVKTKERIERIKNTLQYEKNSGTITVVWQGTEGVQETIVWNNGDSVPNEQQEDIETFFKGISASFFSQQQLTHMTAAEKYDDNKQQAQRLQDLIDGFFPDKMREFEREERSIRQKLIEAFNVQQSIKELEKEFTQLKQEHSSLEKQYKARLELQEPAQRHQLLNAERQRISTLAASPFKNLEQWLLDLEHNSIHRAIDLENSNSLEIRFPHEKELLNADIYINKLISETSKNITSWINDFNNKIKIYFESQQWYTIFSELNHSDAEFKNKLVETGLTEEDISHLQALLENKMRFEDMLKNKEEEIEEKKKSAPKLDLLFDNLYKIWNKQFVVRKNAVSMANQHTSGGQESYKIIEVIIDYQADNKDFLEYWEKLSPDKRSKLGTAWTSIGNRIFETYLQNRIIPELTDPAHFSHTIYNSPWEVIQQAIDKNDTAILSTWIARPDQGLTKIFISHFDTQQSQWQEIRTIRIKDAVDLTLYRADLSPAGMISKSTLSDGQRNTAALVLILSQSETGPLIIDQPEEELDSEFIYNELLPLIRDKKSERQLIFATHNANLPVNGDSELVYAFEARENKGKCLAQGGTDKKEVADAILKVMEGSAEAFQRRKNKYHF